MLTRIVAPSLSLISLDEARKHCRITDSGEDPVLQAFIDAAIAYLDAGTGILGEALVTQTWRLTLDCVPFGDLELPLGPVQSITQIQYVDLAGATQTFSAANYRLSGQVVELVSGASWPVPDARAAAFWVDFVAGHGAPAAVPMTIRLAALMLVADMYGQREAARESVTPSPAFEALLAAARSERGLF